MRTDRRSFYGLSQGTVYYLILVPIRCLLEVARLMYVWGYAPLSVAVAVDGRPIHSGLRLRRCVRYGKMPRETLDVILPDRSKPHAGWLATLCELWRNDAIPDVRAAFCGYKRVVLYVHGGGWVVPGTDVQFQQLTPWVRAGHLVYAANYPLAPSKCFPVQLISVLRAMTYLRQNLGHDDVVLVGESAGGNLCSMAAALQRNPALMSAFLSDPAVKLLIRPGETFRLSAMPDVVGFSSWYSILDRTAWREGGGSWFGFAMGKNSVFTRGLAYCFDAYESKSGAFGNRFTLADIIDEVEEYPPTQMVIAGYDPTGLSRSSFTVARMLTARGVHVEVSVFQATHGFVAYPPQIQKYLFGIDVEATQGRANAVVLDFLGKHL